MCTRVYTAQHKGTQQSTLQKDGLLDDLVTHWRSMVRKRRIVFWSIAHHSSNNEWLLYAMMVRSQNTFFVETTVFSALSIRGLWLHTWFKVLVKHYFSPRFIYVEVGHPGSESDGGIFSRSTLQKNVLLGALGLPPMSPVGNEGPLPYFFVGDEAFPLKEYMMRPYPRRSKLRVYEWNA